MGSVLQDRLALHTWTLDTTPLAEVLRIVPRAGWNAVELRHADFARASEAGMTRPKLIELAREAASATRALLVEVS